VRHWLRDRPEREIVVVAHGDFLRYMTDGRDSGEPWGNAEVKEYTFMNDGKDVDAMMIPSGATSVVSGGDNRPLGSHLWLRHAGCTEIVC